MISKELINIAMKCRSKEELMKLAEKENIELNDTNIDSLLRSLNLNKELTNDELENVTGGGCATTYSSETFSSLGLVPIETRGQKPEYHPVITTLLNHCSIGIYSVNCGGCPYCEGIGLVSYCVARSKEHDED